MTAESRLMTEAEFRAQLIENAFEFIDFGCSGGDSMQFGFEKLKAGSGVGLDMDPRKVQATINRGFQAALIDVTTLESHQDRCSFVLLFHFLEHLRGFRFAKQCVRVAMNLARDFVLIKHPWFDSDGWLFRQSLKFYWSDWRGHDYCMSSLDLYRAIRDASIPCRVRFFGRRPVTSSEDLAIHPFDSPIDQHAYKAELHGKKKKVAIPETVPTFYEIQAVILLSTRYEFSDVEPHLDGGQDHCLFEATFSRSSCSRSSTRR